MQDHSSSEGQRVRHIKVSDQDDGQRLDNWLLRTALGVPKSHIYKVVRRGEVRVNGGRAKATTRLRMGDVVRVPPMTMKTRSVVRVPNKLAAVLKNSVVLRTDDFLILNKPAGVPVHGGSGLAFGAIDGVRQALDCPSLELVHRLDRATSGALLIATDRKRCRLLQQQFRERLVGKRYIAMVKGSWPQDLTRVDAPLSANSEHAGERRVMVDRTGGKPAVTRMEVAERFADVSLLHVELETGRTHQIRVHVASQGHPIVGDERYGNNRDNQRYRRLGLSRLYLHSSQLSFNWNGKKVCCQVPEDDSWHQAVEQLRQHKHKR